MRLAFVQIAAIIILCAGYLSSQCPNNIWDSMNEGSTYIEGLGQKAIYGDFTNMDNAQHVNDGAVYYFGNVINNGHIGDGFGEEFIRACDNRETIITGTGFTEFNDLDVDNSAGVFLNTEMEIKENLSFTAGIIRTDRGRRNNRVTFGEGSNNSGAGDDRHVNGTIVKRGAGVFSFPLGDGDHISPMVIRGQNPFDVFEATYISDNLDRFQQASRGVFPEDSTDFNVLRVQDLEFWTLEGGQSTTITLSFTSYSDISRLTDSPEIDLTVVGWRDGQWENIGQTEVITFLGTGTVTSRTVVPNDYEAFTFGVLDTDGDELADSDDIGVINPCVPNPNSQACLEQMCISVDAAVYLEGPLYQNGQYLSEMRTQLNDFGYLPGQRPRTLLGIASHSGQPYNRTPWLYDGTEGDDIDELNSVINNSIYREDVVDWVLVSLRTTTSYTSTVCTKAAWVLQDGTIELTDFFDCCDQDTDEFYLVVEHRNHLAVMTPTPIRVDDGGMISYDFRSNDSYSALLGSTQKEIFPGMFAMFAANSEQELSFESSRDINANDNGFWARANGRHSGYFNSDFDMNGDVNVHDRALWGLNNGVFTDVDTPFNQ